MDNKILVNSLDSISDDSSNIIDKIKYLLMKPCNMIQKVDFTVESYQEVIDLWIKYKNNGIKISDYLIESAFKFHKSNIDHIILYHSHNQSSTLLMCKIGEKYKNISIDNNEMKNVEYFQKYKPNFIATYY